MATTTAAMTARATPIKTVRLESGISPLSSHREYAATDVPARPAPRLNRRTPPRWLAPKSKRGFSARRFDAGHREPERLRKGGGRKGRRATAAWARSGASARLLRAAGLVTLTGRLPSGTPPAQAR